MEATNGRSGPEAPRSTGFLEETADYLEGARLRAEAVPQLPPGLPLADAYRIQHAVVGRRLARGERLAGTKLGMTSRAKMAQMGISEIICGQLTDAMMVPDGGTVDLARLIHPRVEPEVAFRLARDVDLTGPDAEVDILACVDAVAPGLEIIDSRYADFRFSLPDVVADNTSAAFFVVGPWRALDEAAREALGDLVVELVIDGEVVERGSTGEILGHPLDALRALVPLARERGFPLTAGQVLLAGAATAAAPLRPARVEARVARLGTASAVAERA
ncbi:2-keto-4-pentenoate hydratase [Pseudofrankia asymbiotica]|uniref:2-keto-4-pentenoate hydratase n=1 Tax=Pseudofrankia asymbiotica TaxID=1834516 RepID=UPI003B75CA3D